MIILTESPWCVIRMPGGVRGRGRDRYEKPFPLLATIKTGGNFPRPVDSKVGTQGQKRRRYPQWGAIQRHRWEDSALIQAVGL